MFVDNYRNAPLSPPLAPIGNMVDDLEIIVYNNTGSDQQQGAIFALSYYVDATDTSNPIVRGEIAAAAATLATPGEQIVVVTDAQPLTTAGTYGIPTGKYGKVMLGGVCKALVDGTTDVAAGDQLKLTNGATAFVQNVAATAGASGLIDTKTVAIALEARTANSAGLQYVLMLNKKVIV